MAPVSRAFRATLREELPKWADEGLVGPEVAAHLRDRYRLDEDGGAYAALAAYLLGAGLVAGGVISFVAWNWLYLPDAAKLTGGVVLLIMTQVTGYVLWRVDGRRPWLGQGLIFLGLLLFGANLGLFAQVFNVHDHWRHGVGAWALVGLALALSARSRPCAFAAAGLTIAWGLGQMKHAPGLEPLIAYGVGMGLSLLAWSFRSRFVILLAVAGTGVLLTAAGARELGLGGIDGLIFYVPLGMSALAFGTSLAGGWPAVSLRRLALGTFTLLLYAASFEDVAYAVARGDLPSRALRDIALLMAPALALAVVGAAARLRQRRRLDAPEEISALCLIGFVTIVVAAVSHPWLVATVAHLGLTGIAGLSIRRALGELDRGPFWFGVTVAGLVILTRFLELETGLLLKAGVFTTLGVAVIAIGYAFESRRREVTSHV